jgi:hypothetical protein
MGGVQISGHRPLHREHAIEGSSVECIHGRGRVDLALCHGHLVPFGRQCQIVGRRQCVCGWVVLFVSIEVVEFQTADNASHLVMCISLTNDHMI